MSVGAFACWLLLFAITYEYLPALRYAWGFRLLRYHPDWAAWGLTGIALLFTTDEARRGAIAGARRLASLAGAVPARARDPLLFALVLAGLWAIHERALLGNSYLLFRVIHQPTDRLFPETGGAWVLRTSYEAVQALGLRPVLSIQLVHCAAGAATVLFVVRAARLALPEGRPAGLVAALVFAGGLGVALAGRFETHVLAIAASAAGLWLALRFARGQTGLAPAALASGLAAWLEPLCLLALPGLLLLPRLCGRRLPASAALAVLPVGLYAVYLLVANPTDLPFAQVLGQGLLASHQLVRGWGGGASVGTDVVFLSLPQLKYLVNALFVLAPAALPLLVGLLARGGRRAFAAPEVSFVALTAAGLAIGSLLRRPVWGPFDWDLFAVTALWLAFLAAVLLARVEAPAIRSQVVAGLVGLQLCFVAVPLAALGREARVDAGPLHPERFDARLFRRGEKPPKELRRWL